jgi:hypothetical protein
MQRNCYQRGSVVLDSRTTTWFFRYRAESRQKSVRLGKFATKKAALQAADSVRTRINSGNEEAKPLIANLWEMYKNEKMPTKLPTRLAYDSWTRNHILPRWAGITPATERNPISLVKVEHATRRRKPRSLTVEEFQKVAIHLKEPLRSMAILAVTLAHVCHGNGGHRC